MKRARLTKSSLFVAALAIVMTGQATATPLAESDWMVADFESAVTVYVLSNDVPGGAPLDPSSVVIVSQPMFGSVEVTPSGAIVYTPDPNQVGTDTFEYRVSDTNGAQSNICDVEVDTELPFLPTMLDFTCFTTADNIWHFVGETFSYDPEQLTIKFGGLIDGETTSVGYDGTFHHALMLAPYATGAVSATAEDQFGQESNTLNDEVATY